MLKIKEAIFAALGFRYLLYAELEISFFSCPRKHYQKKGVAPLYWSNSFFISYQKKNAGYQVLPLDLLADE
jgi:hypothetical protein